MGPGEEGRCRESWDRERKVSVVSRGTGRGQYVSHVSLSSAMGERVIRRTRGRDAGCIAKLQRDEEPRHDFEATHHVTIELILQ